MLLRRSGDVNGPELQLGQGGSLVLVVQVAANLAGVHTVAVDEGQERIRAEQNGHNEKNSQHMNASLS